MTESTWKLSAVYERCINSRCFEPLSPTNVLTRPVAGARWSVAGGIIVVAVELRSAWIIPALYGRRLRGGNRRRVAIVVYRYEPRGLHGLSRLRIDDVPLRSRLLANGSGQKRRENDCRRTVHRWRRVLWKFRKYVIWKYRTWRERVNVRYRPLRVESGTGLA